MIARLPDVQAARTLLSTPWSTLEVPSGRIIHKSNAGEGAWSAPSLLVRYGKSEAVLIYAEAYEDCGTERFGLRIKAETDEWVRAHISSARPPFSPVTRPPTGLEVLAKFADHGPSSGELGLGAPLITGSETVVPLLCCWFCIGDSGLLLFADDQIPMNVGMSPAVANLVGNTRVTL